VANFLLLNQYYPPDLAPTGRLLHDVARTLAARGHQVTVLASRRSYATAEDLGPGGVLDGVHVRRIAALGYGARGRAFRMAEYARYAAGALVSAVRSRLRPDLIVALTTPPMLGLVAAVAAAVSGKPHAHWMMDMFPDAVWAHRPRTARLTRFLLGAAARAQLRGSALVVAAGPCMETRIRAYAPGALPVSAVPLWSDLAVEETVPLEAERVRAARAWGPDTLVLLYSGNMGRGHRFTDFLEAARRLQGPGVTWAFAGGGPRRGEVEDFAATHPDARLRVWSYVADEELAATLAAADVHLISLREGWTGIIVPSKLQAAFALGRPVIYVGPTESDVARWIAESGGGWVVAEGDVEGLLTAVGEAQDAEERHRRGGFALAYSRSHFDRDRNRARLADLLEECASRRPTTAEGLRRQERDAGLSEGGGRTGDGRQAEDGAGDTGGLRLGKTRLQRS
jgi:colanic acid biosynthesis glycosyl transferase WcaI